MHCIKIHFLQLTAKQVKLRQLYDELRTRCAQRRIQIVNVSRYCGFVRQIDDLYHWLNERLEITKQENYGMDFASFSQQQILQITD